MRTEGGRLDRIREIRVVKDEENTISQHKPHWQARTESGTKRESNPNLF